MLKYLLAAYLPFSLFAFEPLIVTPFPIVGYQEIPFYDDFHKVQRELLVWYPINKASGKSSESPWDVFQIALNASPASVKNKMPVVVISHGYTGNPHQLSWLIRWLVHNQFIVLGIQHIDLINGKAHVNHWQRALDVKTMIDKFSATPFAKLADLNKIGFAGFSLGGTTAIWVAGGRSTKLDTLIPGPQYASIEDYVRADEALPSLNKEMMSKDWKESRVKAAFVMAPAWAWLFDEKSLSQVSIPTYLIAAENDQVLVTKNNAGYFSKFIPESIYQTISGKAGHYIFISALNQNEREKADPSGELNFLFEEDSTIDRRWIQSQVSEEAVNFFKAVFLGR